ncbi:MAG: glycosyltransferase family 4 protein [Candidatus Hydrogenedentota bacterium]
MTPLNIAVVGACPYPVPQGSQVYMRDTALAFQRAGHNIRLVTYGYGAGDDPSGLPIHRCSNFPGANTTSAGPSIVKPVLDLLLASTLRQVVREHAIDIIDAHNYEALIVALATGGAPVLYHAHNAMADELPHFLRPRVPAQTFGHWLDRTFPKRAHAVIAPHKRLREYLIDGGCIAARVHVVPPHADLDTFGPPATRSGPLRLVYTGNLDAYQNLAFLGRAIECARSSSNNLPVIIATHSPAPAKSLPFRAEIVHLSNLRDLAELLAGDIIFACPRTSWSGYPIKLLNAMAAAAPIVCCESSAHGLTNGLNAIVVPDNDPTAFADAIIRLAQSPQLRRTLGASARTTAEQHHNPNQISRQLDTILHLVASRP